MQKCYNCGKEVDDNTLICPDCGALVRRYTEPVRQAGPEEAEPEQTAVSFPAAQQEPITKGSVSRDAAGRLRLSAGAKVWFIFLLIHLGWSFVTYGSCISVYRAAEEYQPLFDQLPELNVTFTAMLQVVGEYFWAYVAMLVLTFLKQVFVVWFLIAKRRTAVYCIAAASAALALTAAVSGAGAGSILPLFGLAVTGLLLRPCWELLPR